jgi:hypothetical protein
MNAALATQLSAAPPSRTLATQLSAAPPSRAPVI